MARLALLGAALLCALAVSTQGHPGSDEASGRKLLDSHLIRPSDKYNYRELGYDWRNAGLNNCAGDMQSPVNIMRGALADPADRTDASEIDLRGMGASDTYVIGNSGSDQPGVKINLEQDMQLTFESENLPGAQKPQIRIPKSADSLKTFTPLQLHFHHFLSEHTVNGKHFPLEAHLVMKDEDSDQLAVIGILYEYTEEETQDDPFIDRLQDLAKDLVANGASWGDNGVDTSSVRPDFQIDVRDDLLPTEGTNPLAHYGYDGSLTTPPCDERVKWFVFANTRKVSPAQMKVFADATLNAHPSAAITNNRVIQPLNQRQVYNYGVSV
uniref:Carbonic anhydrase n=1 Tax=Dunaliella viridis TaxID=140095 RepID=D2SP68_9CHLO|nr:carbonic anhydrase 2 [Dunaliella viridis]ACL31665.1 carbonic anhydrase 2 [Dunaliella viridis]